MTYRLQDIAVIRGLMLLVLLVALGWLVGCDGDHFCPELPPGRYRMTAVAVSLNCPDFEQDVDYAGPTGRDGACVEHGGSGDSEWTLQVTGLGTASGRLETTDCIWTITYAAAP